MQARSFMELPNSNIAVGFDVGVVQSVSSGSPLFSPNGEVMGALSGFPPGARTCTQGGYYNAQYGAVHAFWSGVYSYDTHDHLGTRWGT